MPMGYFDFYITVRNTGQTAFDAYVGLSIWEGSEQHPGYWAKKKVQLQPGESSTVGLSSEMRNWASGAHNYLVRLYSRALSAGAHLADYDGWTIYRYGSGAPDESAIVAEKSGTVNI